MTLTGQKQELYRITVNLIPRAHKALMHIVETTGYNRTDVVSRSVQWYALAEDIMSRGGEILTRDPETGELSVIKFL